MKRSPVRWSGLDVCRVFSNDLSRPLLEEGGEGALEGAPEEYNCNLRVAGSLKDTQPSRPADQGGNGGGVSQP